MVFYLFLSVGARDLKLVLFLPNFDVIRTKEAEMEPVYIACSERGKKKFLNFKSFRVLHRILEFFLRVSTIFDSFGIIQFLWILTQQN